jgi:hypothetical protein
VTAGVGETNRDEPKREPECFNDARYRNNAKAIDYLALGVANFHEPTVPDDATFVDSFGG